VPPAAPSRAGLTATAAAVAAAAIALALAAGPLLAQPADDVLRPLTTLLAVLGLATTAVGLAQRAPSWAMAAACAFGAELVSTLFDRAARVDPGTALTAAGLLLLTELVAWAAEARDGAVVVVPPDRRQLPKPVLLVLVAVAAWASVTALTVLAASVAVARDVAVAAIGATAIVAVAAALVRSTQRGA
jgi:hypothetical protein